MTSNRVSFEAENVPFGPVVAVVIEVRAGGTTLRAKLGTNGEPVSLDLPVSGPYSYDEIFALRDGTNYFVSGKTSAAAKVLIKSPLRVVLVHLVPVYSVPSRVEELSLTAYHRHGGLNETQTWIVAAGDQNPPPWQVLTAASPADLRVSYHGRLRLKNGTERSIPWTLTTELPIKVSDVHYLQTITIDPSQVQWRRFEITRVLLSVFRLDDRNEKADPHRFVFHQGNSREHTNFVVTYGDMPRYYCEIEYWHRGQDQPGTVTSTHDSLRLLVLPENSAP